MTLTKSDIKLIEDLLDEREERYVEKLTEFKSDFFEKIDPILKEVVTAREERILMENRIENLEDLHPKGRHNFPS